jgi:hypothetical protein
VVDHRANLNGTPSLQLFSDQVAAEHPVDEDKRNPVAGLSGAPIVVDGSVVGIVRFALGLGHPQAGTIYATPTANILANNRSSPIPSGDPYSGLPPLPLIDPPEEPFRYLNQYEREHASVFFGRGWKIRSLIQALTASVATSPPVLFLVGQSGVGKSSLLTAGVFPRLERIADIRYVRCSDDFPIGSAFERALPGSDWNNMESVSNRPLHVILDQTEEVFFRGGEYSARELNSFMSHVRNYLGNPSHRPRGRLTLAFRKEWLQDWDRAFREFAIPRRIIRVDPLTQAGIREVILGLGSSARLRHQYRIERIDQELAHELGSLLSRDEDANISPVLQVWMTELWRDAVRHSEDARSLTLKRFKELELEALTIMTFLRQQLSKLGGTATEHFASGLIFDFLAAHISRRGDGRTLSLKSKADLYAIVSERELKVIADVESELKRVSLLIEPVGPHAERGDTRLVHDTLVPAVREIFDGSDRPGQRARRILESRATEWEEDASGTVLDDHDLGLVEGGRLGMRNWTASESKLVEASKTARKARRIRRRSLKLTAVASVIAIVVLAGFAFQARRATEKAYVASINELANSMLELGFADLRTDPAMSLQLALATLDIANSPRSAQLLRAAVRLVPVWTTISRAGARDQPGIDPEYSNPTDAFLMDPNMSVVLALGRARKDMGISEPGQSLTLFSVPSGKVLATLPLTQNEVLYNTGSDTSDVAVVRSGLSNPWNASVYALIASGFQSPLWSGTDVVDIASSGGHWPLFVLKRDGTIQRLAPAPNDQGVSVVQVDVVSGAKGLAVHPNGNALLVADGLQYKWLQLDKIGAIIGRQIINSDDTLSPWAGGGSQAYAKIGWGLDPRDILILEVRNASQQQQNVMLYAVDANTGSRAVVRSYVARTSISDIVGQMLPTRSGLDSKLPSALIDAAHYFFVTAGTRVALVRPDQRYGTQTEVFDLEWERRNGVLTNLTLRHHDNNILVGQTLPGKRNSATAVALSPSGAYTAVGTFSNWEETNAVYGVGVGRVEQWGTYALDSAENTPRFVELTTDPIVTDLDEPRAYETGMSPVIRLAYSSDGSRLAVLHANGVVNVFRVAVKPSSEQIPEAWSDRLATPDVRTYGPHSRFALIIYGDGTKSLYDFQGERQIELGSVISAGGILKTSWSETRSSLLIATPTTLFEVDPNTGTVRSILEFPSRVTQVQMGTFLTYGLSKNRAFLFLTKDMERFGTLTETDLVKPLLQAMVEGADEAKPWGRSMIEWTPGADGYQAVADMDGKFTTWTLTKDQTFGSIRATPSVVIPVHKPEDGWVSVRRMVDPGILWVNTGSYSGATTVATVREFDLDSGLPTSKYEPPAGGWPKIMYEIKGTFITGDNIVVIFRCGADSKPMPEGYFAGIWSRQGGKPKLWNQLGDPKVGYEDTIVEVEERPGEEIGYVTLSDGHEAQLVRISDGKILARGTIPGSVPLAPPLEGDKGGKPSASEEEYFNRIFRDLDVRGVDYWKTATTVQLPESLKRNIDDAHHQAETWTWF